MLTQSIGIYVDFTVDESYTPAAISLRAGTNFADLTEVTAIELSEPRGWQIIKFPNEDHGWVPDEFT